MRKCGAGKAVLLAFALKTVYISSGLDAFSCVWVGGELAPCWFSSGCYSMLMSYRSINCVSVPSFSWRYLVRPMLGWDKSAEHKARGTHVVSLKLLLGAASLCRLSSIFKFRPHRPGYTDTITALAAALPESSMVTRVPKSTPNA